MSDTVRGGGRRFLSDVVVPVNASARMFGRVALVCGYCQRPSTVRPNATLKITDRGNRIAAHCGACGRWNQTDLVAR